MKNFGEIRLIGGRFRGRTIRFPCTENLRPTPNRIRETLFNWLGQRLDGQSTLDLFSGSGALSLEALSRGATHATIIELQRNNVNALKENMTRLDPALFSNTQIITQDARHAVSALRNESFDIIFADPPFEQFDQWYSFILTESARLLRTEGFLYIEAPHHCQAETPWIIYRENTAGHVHYHFWSKKEVP